MNPLFRQSLRKGAYRFPSVVGRTNLPALRRPLPTARPVRILTPPQVFQKRLVASSVSNKPASQTFEHAATNMKEELGGTASDVAKIIAGANVTTDAVSDTKAVESFVSCRPRAYHAAPLEELTSE
jgi:hypothetical protein